MTPYTWRTFVNEAPTAREGQMERFFFAKKAFHIQIVREKATNKYQKYKSVELGDQLVKRGS